MEKVVNIHAAKTNLSQLVADAEAGKDVFLARNGKRAVRLVPVKQRKEKPPDRRPGQMKGKIWFAPNFDDPLPDDIQAALTGETD